MKLSGWGRFPVHEARLSAPRDVAALRRLLGEGESLIARGAGRAYGDSAVNRASTVQMRHFNRMLAFDEASGQLSVEAGVLLGDVIAAFLKRGWFPPVTPGTKFVTIGGMIAADVHGKNHHVDGGFSNFVDWIDVMGTDGEIRRCSRAQNRDLFEWSLGGMGLTGIILRAAFRLKRVETGWIRQTLLPAGDLEQAMALFEAQAHAPYSVAWIDCLSGGAALGRSLIMLGAHAALSDLAPAQRGRPFETGARKRLSVPVTLPGGLLNRHSVRLFNQLYFWNGRRKAGDSLVDWDSYFYPLDAVLNWNRVYGRRGFAQFQCALPLQTSQEGLRALLQAVSAAGAGSFLAVLKRFGAESTGFSFPMPGYTLALDFPVNRRMPALLDKLDHIVIDHGGRFYLAKDSRMSADTLHASDPRAQAFASRRTAEGERGVFRSQQSDRLTL